MLEQSPENAFNAPQLSYQDQQGQSTNASQVQLPSQQGGQQQQQQFNPFTLLNQAYDYSYPTNNNSTFRLAFSRMILLSSCQDSSTNTLANLRLFASTADAQFGGLGNPTNGFDLASLGLLNPGNTGQTTSDSGAGSDIDSNALESVSYSRRILQPAKV